MRCDAFERWLDEGMPASTAAEARAHARDCVACAAMLHAAEAAEAALGAMPPAAPAGFTAAVLARIEALERPESVAGPARRTAPWWAVIGSEPALWVGLGLAAALFPLRGMTPRVGAALAGVTETAVSAWLSATSAGASKWPELLASVDPAARTAVAAGLALPLLWLLYRAPIWMAESWSPRGRAASRASGSRPRSRR